MRGRPRGLINVQSVALIGLAAVKYKAPLACVVAVFILMLGMEAALNNRRR